MTFLWAWWAACPTLCQHVAQSGLRFLFASSILLLLAALWLKAGRPKHPVYTLLLCQSVLGGVALCLLAALLLNGDASGWWRMPLPSAQSVAAAVQAPLPDALNASSASLQAGTTLSASALPPGGLRAQAGSGLTVETLPTALLPPSPAHALMPPFANFVGTASLVPVVSPYGKAYFLLVMVWLSIALARLIWLALCYGGIYRLCRRAVPVSTPEDIELLQALCTEMHTRLPRLLVSADVQSVFLAGVWRPVLLLPASYRQDFEPDMLQAVLTHEVAHLRDGEGKWTLATRVLCALCWMQPLLGWLCRRREQAAEEVCDQAVLERGHAPRAYADGLLSLALRLRVSRWERAAGSGSVVFRSCLAHRVQKVLQGPLLPPSPVALAARVGIGLGSALLALALSLVVAADPRQLDGSLNDDPRLNQTIRVEAQGVPLGDLLALVAAKTGVRLKADGFTYDDKIIVFGPPRSLKSLMADVAALYNDTWLHSKTGEQHTYRLTRNPRERDYEETLAGETSRRILAQMDAQIKALEETPDQLAKRSPDDPIRKAFANPQTRTATSIFALLTPAQRLGLLDRWQVSLPVSALSPTQKDGIEDLFHGARYEEANSHPDVVSGVMPALVPIGRDQMDQHDITFTILKASGVNRQGSMLSIFLKSPIGFNVETMDIRTDARFVLPPHGDPYTGKAVRVAELPDAQMVREAANQGAWPDRLQALAAKMGLPVVADYYRSPPVLVPSEDETADAQPPNVQALDALCRPEGYLWWQRGQTLLLRKRDWYTQQLYEVPDRWVLAQSRRLKEHRGELTCGDVLSLEELTTNQIAGLNESLGKPADRLQLAGLRELLAVVAACPVDKNAPLAKGALGRDIQPRQVAILPNLQDLQQQRLLTSFLQAFGRKIAPKDITPGDFGFILIPSWRDPRNAGDPGSVSADIMLYTGKGGMGVGYLIALPLALPDDRRDKTRVE